MVVGLVSALEIADWVGVGIISTWALECLVVAWLLLRTREPRRLIDLEDDIDLSESA